MGRRVREDLAPVPLTLLISPLRNTEYSASMLAERLHQCVYEDLAPNCERFPIPVLICHFYFLHMLFFKERPSILNTVHR